jgi:hypothetical protein
LIADENAVKDSQGGEFGQVQRCQQQESTPEDQLDAASQ